VISRIKTGHATRGNKEAKVHGRIEKKGGGGSEGANLSVWGRVTVEPGGLRRDLGEGAVGGKRGVQEEVNLSKRLHRGQHGRYGIGGQNGRSGALTMRSEGYAESLRTSTNKGMGGE